jgi:hypothetical protein
MIQKKLLLPLSLVIVLGVGVIIGYAFIPKKQTPLSQGNKAAQNQESNSSADASESKDSGIKTVSTTESAWDKLWSVYTSPQGISFRYPKQIGVLDRCGSDHKHDPYVAMKVLEDKSKGTVYIAPDYYYDYPATADGSEDTTKPCQQIVNSLDQINGKEVPQTANYSSGNILGGLNIDVRDVKNQDELKQFIKDEFGSGCKINPDNNGVAANEIRLIGSGPEGNCYLNFGYKILYEQEKNKAVAMNLGQDCTIDNGNDPTNNITSYECYISEIADSIQVN